MRAWLIVTLWLVSAPMVSAQEAASDEVRERARADFDEGRTALEAGDVASAIRALERSLQQLPYLPTAFNLAVAHAEDDDAADPTRSANLAHAILAGEFGHLDRRERREVRALLAKVSREVGRVTIQVSGASDPWLELDDLTLPVSATEESTIYVAPGRHTFEVGAEGTRAHRVALHLAAGEREELRVDLSAPPRGTLRVRSPEDVDWVEILGVREGPSPLEASVPVGVYEVGLVNDPGTRRSVSVGADRVREVLLERPPKRWPRVVGGLAAAVLAVGAALAIGLVVRRDDGGPEDDPVFGTIEALRAR
ncbi:MAG: hypothetical protein JJ863_18175 [Deltaproteobacteria bacterium]|nr:hypothetical protein [Deltaproteobacteria bacterium]